MVLYHGFPTLIKPPRTVWIAAGNYLSDLPVFNAESTAKPKPPAAYLMDVASRN